MPAEIPDSHRALLEQRGVGVLTTMGADGYPQSTAVWFVLEGDVIWISLLETRQKVKNLRRNPKCTLIILADAGYKTIELRCDSTLQPDPERLSLRGIIEHYGRDPDTFPDDTSVPRLKLTLTPSHVVARG